MKIWIGLLLALATASPAVAAEDDPSTRAEMARMVDALHTVLPLSLDDRSFSAPENRAAIQAALEALARSGRALPSHASPTDAGFSFLSRSLERDTNAILTRYEAGEWEQARFLLHEVTENCVACHSRRPDPLSRPLGRRLVDEQACANCRPRSACGWKLRHASSIAPSRRTRPSSPATSSHPAIWI